jgi:protein SDA1
MLAFRENPVLNDPKVSSYIKFMTHLSDVMKTQLEFLPGELINIIEQNYNILNPQVRLLIVQALRIMRTKRVATIQQVVPVFLKLFRCKDKHLREYMIKSIIADLKQVNK